MEGHVYLALKEKDPEWPDMQMLFLSAGMNFDFGFVMYETFGYTEEVLKYINSIS